MIVPLPWALGGAALASAVAFTAGWQVQGWRCEASRAEAIEQAAESLQRATDELQAQSEAYEGERAHDAAQARQTGIRQVYRTIAVPIDCAAPDAARGLLKGSIDHANSRAVGEPLGAVSDAP